MTQSPLLQAMTALLQALHSAPFYQNYVVRGSFVSRQWMHQSQRECKDLDLLYLHGYKLEQLIADVSSLLPQIHQVGVQFDASAMQYHAIWEHSISPGVRFTLPGQAGNTPFELQLDIAANDPMISAPLEQVIDGITVRAVPIETMAAWKLHGLFEHLNGPWQSKTLWDLYLLCRYNSLDEAHFIQATKLAFSSRLDPLAIISRLLDGNFGESKKSGKNWQKNFPTFNAKDVVSLSEVLAWLRGYLKPMFAAHYHCPPLLTQAHLIRYRVDQLRRIKDEHPTAVKQKLSTLSQRKKILPHKAYHRIHHLPTSRLGPSERCITPAQYALLTNPEQHQPSHCIIVQEKLDGSCVCAYRKDDKLYALGRGGDLTDESPNISRQMWADWVAEHQDRFMAILNDGERLCGEWLVMVHGTHYNLPHEPFVPFDLYTADNQELNYQDFCQRIAAVDFTKPYEIHYGEPCQLDKALERLADGHHGSIDPPEGLIWRLEKQGKPAFKAKYVRHDKVDGCYLAENTKKAEQWNSMKGNRST